MIRIVFTDWWPTFDINNNFITKAIKGKIDYEIISLPKSAKDVDFVFCSIFGKEALKYNCPRIVFTGENVIPDLNLYDYVIGYMPWSIGDRVVRYPEYAACDNSVSRQIEKNIDVDESLFDREFCSFVVSNKFYTDGYREQLFEKLSNYKFVASGGRYKNNIGQPEGVSDKLGFISKYKFNLACENSACEGYCTEKIIQAWAAKTVPIYWGDPDVGKYFNPKAFINCNDFDNIDDLIEYIKKVDSDKDMYLDILSQPKIIDSRYSIDNMDSQLSEWLVSVLEKEKLDSYRRPIGGWCVSYEKELLDDYIRSREEKKSLSKTCFDFLRRIKNRIRRLCAQ